MEQKANPGSDPVENKPTPLTGWLQKKEKSLFTGNVKFRPAWTLLQMTDGFWSLDYYLHSTFMRENVGAERLAQGERNRIKLADISKILFVGKEGVKFDIVFKDERPKVGFRAANADQAKRWVYAMLAVKDVHLDTNKADDADGEGDITQQYSSMRPPDRRRERESVKVQKDFLDNAEMFMTQASNIQASIRGRGQGTTLGRAGARKGPKGTTLGRPPKARPTTRYQAIKEEKDSEAEEVPPPPPGDVVEENLPQETRGFHEMSRQTPPPKKGICNIFSKPKPKKTAMLPQGYSDAAVKQYVNASMERQKVGGGKSKARPDPRPEDFSGAVSSAQGNRKKSFPGFTKPQRNTVGGDETLRKEAFPRSFEPKAQTGKAGGNKEEEAGPRMAVRPLAAKEANTRRAMDRNQVKGPATVALITETIETSISLSGMLFDDLDSHSMHDLVDKMYRIDVVKGQDVVVQGEVGESFYVIEKGKYHVYLRRDNSENVLPEFIAEKGPKTFFGELALLYEQPAPVTVRAVEDGTIWAIDRPMFFEIRKAQARKRQARKMQCLYSIEVLAENLDTNQIISLAEAMNEKVFKSQDVILDAGRKLDQVLIVASGRVDMYVGDELMAQMVRGDTFGAWALLEHAAVSDVKLVASQDRTTTLMLEIEEFESLVGDLRTVIKRNWEESVGQIFPGAVSETQQPQDFEEVVRGTLKTLKEKSLKNGSFTPRLPSSTSLGDEEDDESEIDDDDDAKSAIDKEWEMVPLICDGVTLDDVAPLDRLGKGSFGRVHLVKDAGTMKGKIVKQGAKIPEFMALKVLQRNFIVQNGWEDMVENERHAMAELVTGTDCPFIVQLYAAFYDKKNIYFLMELCSGGDMYAQLRKQKGDPKLKEAEARFYIGATCLGMEAIHSREIVYRDLKPENVFLHEDGYIRIADFGLAKKTKRTFTVCGTPEYMAPEIILGRGHDQGVDWWAVGVFTFELICGVSPFPGRAPMDIYERVLAHNEDAELKWPEGISVSKDCKRFVQDLLHPLPGKRMRVIRKGITEHAFFVNAKSFTFEKLFARQLKPPMKITPRETKKYAGNSNKYAQKFFNLANGTKSDRSGWQPNI